MKSLQASLQGMQTCGSSRTNLLRRCSSSRSGSTQPWQPSSAHQRRRSATTSAALPELAGSLLAVLASLEMDPAQSADTFEPQMRPEILVAAAFAATPPVLFWARIFISAQKRQKAIDDERAAEEQRQRDREELKRKITGQQ